MKRIEVMNCPNCNAPVTLDEKFCGECGHPLIHSQVQPPVPQAVRPPDATAVAQPPYAPQPEPRKKRRVWLIVLIVIVLLIACGSIVLFGSDIGLLIEEILLYVGLI
jgi:hypothetical protein